MIMTYKNYSHATLSHIQHIQHINRSSDLNKQYKPGRDVELALELLSNSSDAENVDLSNHQLAKTVHFNICQSILSTKRFDG